MKKNLASQSAFFNRRFLISFAFCSVGVVLALLAFALYPGANALANQSTSPARSLTSEEAHTIAEGIRPLVNRSTEGLIQRQHADGSVSMNLEGRFQNVIVAKKEASGKVSQSCVEDADSAAAFFGIDPQLISPGHTAPATQAQPGPRQSDDR
jgi:hypothetical protein